MDDYRLTNTGSICYSNAMIKEEISTAKKKYWSHYSNARRRKILWQFTFESWIKIWLDSSHWSNRGTKKGQYVMSRIGDIGPYSPTNVFIQTQGNNVRDGSADIPKKHITKVRMSIASLGKPKPKLQCEYCTQLISVSNMKKHQSIHQ